MSSGCFPYAVAVYEWSNTDLVLVLEVSGLWKFPMLVLKQYLLQSKPILLIQFLEYPSRALLSADRFIESSIAAPQNIYVI